MAFLVPVLFLALSVPVLAAQPPEEADLSLAAETAAPKKPRGKEEIPERGVDFILTGGKTPREFFENRAKDAACVDDLTKARAAHRKLLAEVDALKQSRNPLNKADHEKINDKIDAYEIPVVEARDKMLQYMEICGECATRPLELEKKPSAGKTQKWYISNGSCQIPSKDPKVLATAFENLSESLLHSDQYPKTAEGGFSNILAFKVADPTDLQVQKIDRFPKSALNLYLWVLGPKFGTLHFAFYYYLSANYGTQGAGLAKEFWLEFRTMAEPRLKGNWKAPGAPEIANTTLSGRTQEVSPLALKNVRGQWYATGDGYVRYYTSAEFPIEIKEIETKGRRILIDTLVDAAARGKWDTL